MNIYACSYSKMLQIKNKKQYDILYIGVEWNTPAHCKICLGLIPEEYKMRKFRNLHNDIASIQSSYRRQLERLDGELMMKILKYSCPTGNILFVSEDEENIYRFILKKWINVQKSKLGW